MAQQNQYTINGFVDTNKTIGENLNKIAQAANSFITYDSQTGQFSILFNDYRKNIDGATLAQIRATPELYSEANFDDDNILGSMIITETASEEIYNLGTIKFNSASVPGALDSIKFDLRNITSAYTLGYSELYNYDLNDPIKNIDLTNEFINNDIQAVMVLQTLINSSRQDTIVEFETDYSMIGLNAGDMITITNDNVGWTNKEFRIIELEEIDNEDGTINLKLVCQDLRYDAYEFLELVKRETTRAAGIPPIDTNTDVQSSNDQKSANDVARGAIADPDTISQYVSQALTNSSSYFLALLNSLQIPTVGGATFHYSASLVNSSTLNALIGASDFQNLLWHIHNPYDDTAGQYFPYTLELRKDPVLSGSTVVTDGTLYETYRNDGSVPNIVIQQANSPVATWQFKFIWDSTPSLSDIDSDRYRDVDTSTYYAMRLGGLFLYY